MRRSPLPASGFYTPGKGKGGSGKGGSGKGGKGGSGKGGKGAFRRVPTGLLVYCTNHELTLICFQARAEEAASSKARRLGWRNLELSSLDGV
jgi:hypothetical protein